MKKIYFCLCLITFLLVGCADKADRSQTPSAADVQNSQSTDSITEEQPPFALEEGGITAYGTNLYDLDFNALQGTLEKALDTAPGQLSIPFMYQRPSIDIYFLPNGDITRLDMSLWKIVGENQSEIIVSGYTVAGQTEKRTKASPRVTINAEDAWQEQSLLKTVFADKFNNSKLSKFVEWASGFDFTAALEEYIPDEPQMYELIAGVKIQRQLLDAEDMHCVFLDCSSGLPVQIDYKDIPNSSTGAYSFEPENTDYYAILPHYPGSKANGYPPLYVCTPPEDAENEYAFYSPEDKAFKESGYVINNVIIIFPNGFEE